jgi:hypothetical protein
VDYIAPLINMGWPYEFINLTDEEKHQRRIALEYYAYVAFLSAFAPCLVSILVRLIARVRRARRSQYSEVPGSPGVKARQQRWITRMIGKWSAAQWWLGEDVYFLGSRWGQRDEWVLGVAWTLWMLILCVRGTGKGKTLKLAGCP